MYGSQSVSNSVACRYRVSLSNSVQLISWMPVTRWAALEFRSGLPMNFLSSSFNASAWPGLTWKNRRNSVTRPDFKPIFGLYDSGKTYSLLAWSTASFLAA